MTEGLIKLFGGLCLCGMLALSLVGAYIIASSTLMAVITLLQLALEKREINGEKNR